MPRTQIVDRQTPRPKPSTERIRRKLERIIIPKLEFREATIREAIEFLKKKSVELDVDSPAGEKGVNIVLKLETAAVAAAAAVAPARRRPRLRRFPAFPAWTPRPAAAAAAAAPAAAPAARRQSRRCPHHGFPDQHSADRSAEVRHRPGQLEIQGRALRRFRRAGHGKHRRARHQGMEDSAGPDSAHPGAGGAAAGALAAPAAGAGGGGAGGGAVMPPRAAAASPTANRPRIGSSPTACTFNGNASAIYIVRSSRLDRPQHAGSTRSGRHDHQHPAATRARCRSRSNPSSSKSSRTISRN